MGDSNNIFTAGRKLEQAEGTQAHASEAESLNAVIATRSDVHRSRTCSDRGPLGAMLVSGLLSLGALLQFRLPLAGATSEGFLRYSSHSRSVLLRQFRQYVRKLWLLLGDLCDAPVTD
jgi:hypothetical protein